MDDRTATGFAEQAPDESDHCTTPFRISELLESKKDKLGRDVKEILWLGPNYAVYRTEKSVHVQFADCKHVEAVQRRRFTRISPELCELRYLTDQLDHTSVFGWRSGKQPASLYHHNMAQAVMLVMEHEVDDGKKLALHALNMAVERVTNDYTVRHLRTCLIWWAGFMLAGGLLLGWLTPSHTTPSHSLWFFVIAAMSGASGAVFSVTTRLTAFQLKPCHQSNMNKWMGRTRVLVGLMAGLILLLLAKTILENHVSATNLHIEKWEAVAVLGFIAGFAERLIPTLLNRAAGQIESKPGTPVQAVREGTK